MRAFFRGLWRRIEDYLFVRDLSRIQSWRKRLTPAFRKQEEERRQREIVETTLDRTASF